MRLELANDSRGAIELFSASVRTLCAPSPDATASAALFPGGGEPRVEGETGSEMNGDVEGETEEQVGGDGEAQQVPRLAMAYFGRSFARSHMIKEMSHQHAALRCTSSTTGEQDRRCEGEANEEEEKAVKGGAESVKRSCVLSSYELCQLRQTISTARHASIVELRKACALLAVDHDGKDGEGVGGVGGVGEGGVGDGRPQKPIIVSNVLAVPRPILGAPSHNPASLLADLLEDVSLEDSESRAGKSGSSTAGNEDNAGGSGCTSPPGGATWSATSVRAEAKLMRGRVPKAQQRIVISFGNEVDLSRGGPVNSAKKYYWSKLFLRISGGDTNGGTDIGEHRSMNRPHPLIEMVTFDLHPSFPNPKKECRVQPYQCGVGSWGVFEVVRLERRERERERGREREREKNHRDHIIVICIDLLWVLCVCFLTTFLYTMVSPLFLTTFLYTLVSPLFLTTFLYTYHDVPLYILPGGACPLPPSIHTDEYGSGLSPHGHRRWRDEDHRSRPQLKHRSRRGQRRIQRRRTRTRRCQGRSCREN